VGRVCDELEEIVVELKTSFWKNFWQNQSGQDMVEYTLLLAFVCLVSAALFIGVGRNVAAIWGYSSTSMQQAYCAASASS
jgi:Flp pilus assembly pilin Flp